MNRASTSSLPVLLLVALLLPVGTGCEGASGQESDPPTQPAPHVQAANPVAAGRYLVVVAGCNDCHTAGYLQSEGEVPESEWLTGSAIGWRGPWGTTYPSNLRLTVSKLSEDAWVSILHTRTALPPMPWMNVAHLSDRDARAIYRYIKSLEPKLAPVPAHVPPDQEPATPYLDLVPQHMERLQPVTSSDPVPAARGDG